MPGARRRGPDDVGLVDARGLVVACVDLLALPRRRLGPSRDSRLAAASPRPLATAVPSLDSPSRRRGLLRRLWTRRGLLRRLPAATREVLIFGAARAPISAVYVRGPKSAVAPQTRPSRASQTAAPQHASPSAAATRAFHSASPSDASAASSSLLISSSRRRGVSAAARGQARPVKIGERLVARSALVRQAHTPRHAAGI